MAFCPICKNEYREGILICPDCNCELTEELTETEPPVLTIRSEKVKDRFVDYLSYSGINTRVSRDENDERFELYCDKADTDRVRRAFAVFVAVETGNAAASRNNSSLEQATMIADVDDVNDISIPEDWEDALETEEEIDEEIRDLLEEDAVSEITAPAFMHKRQAPTQYVSAAEKSRDTKETGFTLIVIGIVLGAIVIGFACSGNKNLYAEIVMGVMALLMVIYGFYSLSKSRRLLTIAAEEDAMTKKIRSYLQTELTKENLEAAAQSSDAEGPELDLIRQDYLIEQLKEHFPDADEPLLLWLADDWYNEQFDTNS